MFGRLRDNPRKFARSAMWVTGFVLFVGIVVYLMTHYWDALGTNLVSELLGIVATVVFIAGWLGWRENRKWLPARQLVYADLLEAIDRFIPVLPDKLWEHIRPDDSLEEYWWFGDSRAVCYHRMKQNSLERRTFPEDLGSIERFSKLREEVSSILGGPTLQLDGALLTHLVRLGHTLKEATSGGVATGSRVERFLAFPVAEEAVATRAWLLREADKRTTFQDEKRKYEAKMADRRKVEEARTGRKKERELEKAITLLKSVVNVYKDAVPRNADMAKEHLTDTRPVLEKYMKDLAKYYEGEGKDPELATKIEECVGLVQRLKDTNEIKKLRDTENPELAAKIEELSGWIQERVEKHPAHKRARWERNKVLLTKMI